MIDVTHDGDNRCTVHFFTHLFYSSDEQFFLEIILAHQLVDAGQGVVALRADRDHGVAADLLGFDYRAIPSVVGGLERNLGLSSPAEPILKSKVYRWLTTSPWHKWVIAFTSARLCDGGAGATYVLLRRKPIKKRFRKPRKKRG